MAHKGALWFDQIVSEAKIIRGAPAELHCLWRRRIGGWFPLGAVFCFPFTAVLFSFHVRFLLERGWNALRNWRLPHIWPGSSEDASLQQIDSSAFNPADFHFQLKRLRIHASWLLHGRRLGDLPRSKVEDRCKLRFTGILRKFLKITFFTFQLLMAIKFEFSHYTHYSDVRGRWLYPQFYEIIGCFDWSIDNR